MSDLDLSILIVSHGHETSLRDCLRSLEPMLEGVTAELLLVDNLGTGTVMQSAESLRMPVRLQINRAPQGFARNINEASEKASGRSLLLLNPDTVFVRGRLARALEVLWSTADAGIIGCRLLNPDGSLQRSYRRFPTVPIALARGFQADRWKTRPEFYRFRMMDGVGFDALAPVDWVYGAFMLMKRSAFIAYGRMDERFRLYYEDVDLSYRFREHGLKTYYFPELELMHGHQRTSAAQPLGSHWRYHVNSACRYFWKHRYVIRPRWEAQGI